MRDMMEANSMCTRMLAKSLYNTVPSFIVWRKWNGPDLTDICFPENFELKAVYKEDILGGLVVLSGEGLRSDSSWEDELYRPVSRGKKSVPISTVPYAFWGNRQPGEMTVWIREK